GTVTSSHISPGLAARGCCWAQSRRALARGWLAPGFTLVLCSFPWVVFLFLSLSTYLHSACFAILSPFVVLRISPSLAFFCSQFCCDSAAFASNRRGRGQSLS
ncbi:hypothetical protein CCMA1212_005918, partial [Trichoderma ghanense]